MSIKFISSRSLLVSLCGLAVLSLASCSQGGRKSVYSASGKVFFRGQPAQGALVTLIPLEDDDSGTPRPGAQVKKDGSFRLSTYRSYDGAPAGSYAVAIVYRSPIRKVDDENAGPDLLQGKYSDPKKTPLRVVIQEGPNELTPFDLK
jgi:hypothetical protein